MANTTQVLIAQFQQQALDEVASQQEVAEQPAAEEQLRYLASFHKFELMDGLFVGFCNTNKHRGKQFSFDEVLGITSSTAFRFEHLGIPYRATVIRYADVDVDWINIKLPNNGFVYTPKEGRQLSRHMSQGWVSLPVDKFLPYMGGLAAKLRPFYTGVSAYYNFSEQRFDMKFVPAEEDTPGKPHLLVTYEPGYPDYDDRAPVYSLR